MTGLLYLGLRGHQIGLSGFNNSWGVTILIGAALGITMWFNVWFVIWPNQKIVIESATLAAQGKAALPEAANAGARGLTASRTNTMFSIPLLFFMASASHLPLSMGENSKIGIFWGCFAVIWAALEFNALKGKTGPITTIKGVITAGFVLTFVLFGLLISFA